MQIPRALRLRSGQANPPRKRGRERLGMTKEGLSGMVELMPSRELAPFFSRTV